MSIDYEAVKMDMFDAYVEEAVRCGRAAWAAYHRGDARSRTRYARAFHSNVFLAEWVICPGGLLDDYWPQVEAAIRQVHMRTK